MRTFQRLALTGVVALALAGVAPVLDAQPGPGYGAQNCGPDCTGPATRGGGMMGGSGMTGGGMMGGHGMTGGDMMREPGMMGGHGGGPGPHGGPGWEGHGSMMDALDLTAEQHDKIRALHEDAREKSWDTMGKLRTETYKLRNLYRGDQLDAKAIDEQQKKVDDLRRQLLQARIGVHNQIVGILTPEQRAKLHNFAPWRMHGDMD